MQRQARPMPEQVLVIGAGVVGMACAVRLLADGHRVTVVDREAPGEACSFGNAGIIGSGYCVPLSMPGTLRQVPGWLIDPLGPLAIRPSHAAKLAPWLLRFLRAGTRRRAEAISQHLRAFFAPSLDAWKDLLRTAGASDLLRTSGYLYVYESALGFEKSALAWELRRSRGVRFERLGEDEIRQLEPTLDRRYAAGAFFPDDGHVRNPHRVVTALAEHFAAAGGTVRRAEVKGFETAGAGPRVRITRVRADGDLGEAERPDRVVLAAGVWSARLAALLGCRIPLEAERGYHVVLESPGVAPRIPVTSGEAMFFATPMDMGLRIAGTAEFAGIEAAPDWRRAEALLGHARTMFPGVQTRPYTQWMGHRPSTPDSMPVVGRCPGLANTLLAFGHGHVGLTGAAVTARLVTDLMAGRAPPFDPAPYAPDRF